MLLTTLVPRLLGSDMLTGLNVLWISFTVIVALATWHRYHRPLHLLLHDIGEFVRQSPRSPVRSLHELQTLDNTVHRYAVLGPVWRLYYSAACQYDWSKGFPNPLPFFIQERLIDLNGHRRIAEAIPGFLTALGILGTFVGLSVGLAHLNVENLGSVEGLQEAVRPLLGGMRLAFYTSVAGIFCSIAWSAADRWYLSKTLNRLGELHDRLDTLFPPVLETELLHELVHTQQQQVAELKSFMSDTLIPQMFEGFRQAIEQSLATKVERTVTAIEQIGAQVGDRQLQGVQEMVDSFIERLGTALYQQVEDLSQVLRDTIEWQRTVKLELSDLLAAVKEAGTAQKESLASATQLLDRLNDMATSFEERNRKIAEAIGTLEDVLTGLVDAQERTHKSLEMTTEAYHHLSALRNQLDQLSATQLREMSALWTETRGEMLTLAADLRAASNELRQKLGEDLRAFAERMHDGLGKTFSDFDKYLGDATSKLGAVVSGIQESSEALPGLLRGFRRDVTETIEKLARAASDTNSSFQQFPVVLRELQQHLEGVVRGMQDARAQLAVTSEGGQHEPSERSDTGNAATSPSPEDRPSRPPETS